MSRKGRLNRKKLLRNGILLFLVACVLFPAWVYQETRAPQYSETKLVRYDTEKPLAEVLADLKDRGIIRNVRATMIVAQFTGKAKPIAVGTYRFRKSSSSFAVLRELIEPIHQMVRLPETNWAARSARLLEKHDVCSADDYMSLVHQPELFQNLVSFPLPKGSLEGYLYPDTYELPPLMGAKPVIERQLKAFEEKVWNGLDHPKDLAKVVIEGSLVELEVKYDNERPIVAGIIENRLKKKMPLQIDASINYGLQVWRPLAVSEYKSVKSDYNLYLHKGLPPGPICSPTAKSIDAAIHPANHKFLYYVALPGGVSLFSETYKEHLKNVKKRRDEVAKLKGEDVEE